MPTGPLHHGLHPLPEYFLVGEAFRRIHDLAVGAATWPIDTYRQYAAVVAALGMAACAYTARRLGLRPAGQVAAAFAFAPVAAPSVLVYSTMVNPMSAAVLCGALVAGTALRWMITGRGSAGWRPRPRQAPPSL